MRKIMVIIFVLIMCFQIHAKFVYAEPNFKEDIFKDTLLTLVSRNINDAIVGYFGEYRDFHLYSARVMEIRRIEKKSSIS
ncbi:hypothetical protein Q5O89_01085 [Peribacillus frigoritolerans]|nr:hypothetical protein [Peribacillus frigoritolerans]